MATRSIVAYPTETGFEGYYVHWDGYPSGVGCGVYEAFSKLGETGLKAFLEEHPEGFSEFPYVENLVSGNHSHCYCSRATDRENPELLNDKNAVAAGCEYAYVLKSNLLYIYSAYSKSGTKMIGMFGQGDAEAHWNLVTVVDMNKPQPDWSLIDNAAFQNLSLV